MAVNKFEVGKWYELDLDLFYSTSFTNSLNVSINYLKFVQDGEFVFDKNMSSFYIENTKNYIHITNFKNATWYISPRNGATTGRISKYIFRVRLESTPSAEWANVFNEIQIPRALVSIWNSEDYYWYNLPCPSDYTGTSTTLVDSGRNTQGQVVGSVIASDIAKVEMKWNFLLPEQYSFIAKLFEQKYGGSFFVAVSFFDTIKNDWDGSTETSPSGKDGNNPCRVFYCGDRKVSFAKMVLNDDGTPKGYSGVSLNLIDTGKYYGE